jgi:hypothetical protein
VSGEEAYVCFRCLFSLRIREGRLASERPHLNSRSNLALIGLLL